MKEVNEIEETGNELAVVWDIYNRYPLRISDKQLKFISFFATHTENFRLVSDAEMYQCGRRYVELTFEYDSGWYEGSLKIEI